jgi:hypothetical protein
LSSASTELLVAASLEALRFEEKTEMRTSAKGTKLQIVKQVINTWKASMWTM